MSGKDPRFVCRSCSPPARSDRLMRRARRGASQPDKWFFPFCSRCTKRITGWCSEQLIRRLSRPGWSGSGRVFQAELSNKRTIHRKSFWSRSIRCQLKCSARVSPRDDTSTTAAFYLRDTPDDWPTGGDSWAFDVSGASRRDPNNARRDDGTSCTFPFAYLWWSEIWEISSAVWARRKLCSSFHRWFPCRS